MGSVNEATSRVDLLEKEDSAPSAVKSINQTENSHRGVTAVMHTGGGCLAVGGLEKESSRATQTGMVKKEKSVLKKDARRQIGGDRPESVRDERST